MKRKRLHKIGNSKEPTPQQMLKMAENLRSKLDEFVSVLVEAKAHYSSSTLLTEYGIYHAGTATQRFKTWPEALSYYRKLMKG